MQKKIYLSNEDRLKYEECLEIVEEKLKRLLDDYCLKTNTYAILGSRIKDDKSIQEKVIRKNISDFKNEITDIAGIRIIFCDTIFKNINMEKLNNSFLDLSKENFVNLMCNLAKLDDNFDINIINNFITYLKNNLDFEIIEEINYIDYPKKSGYQSYHFVVLINGFKVEIQIRNLLQHLWAECEHRNVYKNKISNNENSKFYKEQSCFIKEKTLEKKMRK